MEHILECSCSNHKTNIDPWPWHDEIILMHIPANENNDVQKLRPPSDIDPWPWHDEIILMHISGDKNKHAKN
jgi:hypothetical protein